MIPINIINPDGTVKVVKTIPGKKYNFKDEDGERQSWPVRTFVIPEAELDSFRPVFELDGELLFISCCEPLDQLFNIYQEDASTAHRQAAAARADQKSLAFQHKMLQEELDEAIQLRTEAHVKLMQQERYIKNLYSIIVILGLGLLGSVVYHLLY